MEEKNFTYILLVVVVVAIAVSVKAYIFTRHPDMQSDPAAITEPAINTTEAVPAQTKSVTKNGTSTNSSTTTTVTPPAKPVATTVQTSSTVVTAPSATVTPISLPYDVINFSHNNTWQAILGVISLKPVDGPYKRNLLTVKSTNSTDGIAELSGSEGWTDYSYTLNGNFISGPAFSLIGRYQDSKNYVKCIFSQGGVTRIDTVIDGKTSTVSQSDDQIPSIPHIIDVDYTLKVKDDTVACLVNGSAVTATVKKLPSAGGIGLDVYNSTPGSSELDVVSIHATAL